MYKKLLIALIIFFPTIAHAQVLINEIAWMGTAGSSSDEWLELYNDSDSDIDLTGWKLTAVDGSPAVILTGTIKAHDFFLLERTDDDTVPGVTADQIYSGSLSNTGEDLQLINLVGETVDEIIAITGWPGGDNATKQTLERKDASSWQTSLEAGGTPKKINSTPVPDDENSDDDIPTDLPTSTTTPTTNVSTGSNTYAAKKGDIIITEILPDPAGSDLEQEFIELQNTSQGTIDITGWKITNLAKQEFIIPSWIMSSGAILTFYRPQTGLALNNLKEKISLYSITGTLINQVEYKNAVTNQGYDSASKTWQNISPGQNSPVEKIINPVASFNGPAKINVGEIILLDASDSFDPEQRDLEYWWDFGDGRISQGIIVRQVFSQAGKYTITLKVSASELASSTDKLAVTVAGPTLPKDVTSTSTPTTTPEIINPTEIPFIFMSEFLPDPDGSDTDLEFIELFNNENRAVNLIGWQLSDGGKPYTLTDTIIKPQQYLALWRPQTKISLNNDADTIKLLAPGGTIVDVASYEDSKSGQSFVLDENFIWQRSKTPTPGEINVLDPVTDEATTTDQIKTNQPKVLGTKTVQAVPTNANQNRNKYLAIGGSVIILGALTMVAKKKLKK